MDKYLELNNISSYKKAFNLSNHVWDIVLKWDYFAKNTVGQQLVRSVDSISANIAEGFGRYTKKDKIKFYRISFGSLKETEDWLNKAFYRRLITKSQHHEINKTIQDLPREINSLIRFTNDKLKY
jgi:four helix bundle protein